MSSSTLFSDLRGQFTREWIKVGDCPIRFCTQECCIGLERLSQNFGIRHEYPEEISDWSPKAYHPTEDLLAYLPESKVFDWKITFEIFNHLRHRKAWERENPLEGYLEIPEMMAQILSHMNWPDGFNRMAQQLPTTNRSRLHEWFVQAFVDELFPDSLLRNLAAVQEPIRSFETSDLSRPQSWLKPSPNAFQTMQDQLASEAISVPNVPRWLSHQLCEHRDGWAWGTDPQIDPWAVYSLFGEAAPSQLDALLSPSQPDFWLAGQRGHGINSYGFGVVSRVGPLFVAHQHGWGGVYMDAERATSMVNGGLSAWNSTLDAVSASINESLRVAVVYSDYRNYAQIWVRGEVSSVPSSSESLELAPTGWSTLWRASGEDDVGELWDLHQHEDVVVAIAAGHLNSLLIDRQL